jgi:N-acetyl-gamma-glutamyl-phosphate reductase
MYSIPMKLTVAVAGASGYAGGELLRLLAQHPHFDVTVVSAASKAGSDVTSVHPHLRMWRGTKFADSSPKTLQAADVIFLALPHGASAEIVAQLPADKTIIDLGADFRLESAEQWTTYYGTSIPHAGTWIYGLPELSDISKIASAKRVANPGCYATAIALGAAPAVKNDFIDASDIVVVAASGTSGAGRAASETLLATEIMGSISSYKTGGVHQHTPEIEQTLSHFTSKPVKLSFTPLLAPMSRGIHATITAKLTREVDVHEIYDSFFADAPFINVLPAGEQPKTASVLGSNHVHIQAMVDAHTQRLVVTVAIDNLAKGAASQAIQNANLMCGFDQTTGLLGVGVAP